MKLSNSLSGGLLLPSAMFFVLSIALKDSYALLLTTLDVMCVISEDNILLCWKSTCDDIIFIHIAPPSSTHIFYGMGILYLKTECCILSAGS